VNSRRTLTLPRSTARSLAILALGTLLLASGAHVATASVARPAAFGSPERILAGGAYAVSLAVDSGGHTHVAVERTDGIWYVTDRTGAWTRSRVFSNPVNDAYEQPSLALDENDRVTIAATLRTCLDCAPGGTAGVHLVSDKGRARGSFSQPVRVTRRHTAWPSLKSVRNRIYLAYAHCGCRPGPFATPIWFAIKFNGSWSRTKAFSGDGAAPSLRVNDAGFPRIAFWTASGLRYATARTRGGDFTTTRIPGTSFRDGAPSLVFDSNRRGHIAFGRGGELGGLHASVRYVRQAASGWSTPRLVTSDNARSVAISIDTADRPHVLRGARGVSEHVLRSGGWNRKVATSSMVVDSVAIRASSSGRTVVAFASRANGAYVANLSRRAWSRSIDSANVPA
jgi:hypothetical protein